MLSVEIKKRNFFVYNNQVGGQETRKTIEGTESVGLKR